MRKATLIFFLLTAIALSVSAQTAVSKGDVNGDGNVTVSDAMAIIDHIHGNPPAVFNHVAADLNSDGSKTVTDAMITVDIIHNGSVDGGGSISGWTEGNTDDEQLTQDLEEEEGD